MGETGTTNNPPGKLKLKLNHGLREVQTVQVIRTLNCIGTGMEDDPVRTFYQYWTTDGELISGSDTEKRFDQFVWLEQWVEHYENKVGDGKAREFWQWINCQPMAQG